MTVTQHRAMAELRQTSDSPTRLRVLDLRAEYPEPVRRLLVDTLADASALSRQPAVLRPAGMLTAR